MPAPGSRDAQLYAIKERAAARLMPLPGVTAVGLGGREQGGRPTGEVVLKVFVERKRPVADLAPGTALPAEFEGLGVDVGELTAPVSHGRLQADDAPPATPLAVGARPTTEADTDLRRYRPLSGGANLLPATPGGWYGTLCCLLTHTTDPAKVYALTAFHSFSRTAADPQPVAGFTRVGQPNAASSPTKCCANLIGTYAGGGADTVRDAALIQLDAGTPWLAEILQIGVVTGTHTVTVDEAATLTYPILKRGANTRVTGGTVVSVNTTATTAEGITRRNLVLVTPNPYIDPQDQPIFFAAAGDSGAAYLNANNEIVALHVAGSATGTVHNGFGAPIEATLAQFMAKEQLPLAVATATTLGQVRTVPGAALRAGPAELPPPGGLPTYQELFGQVGVDLDATPAGRRLLDLWLDHHVELLALVNDNRRVTIAWHRGGGPALLQTFARTVADPELTMPYTINGEPPARRLDRIYAAFHAAASPDLRRALDEAHTDLPDPAGMTYPQLLAALAMV